MTEFSPLSDQSLPPQNVEAEESILGGILLDPEAIARVAEIIPAEAFYLQAHQTIYRGAIALQTQGKPTDLMNLSTWLADQELLDKVGGKAKLAQLADRTVSAVNIDGYAQLVLDKYLRRQLINAGHKIVQFGFDTTEALNTILDRAEQSIFAITQERPQSGLVPLSETLIETYDQIEGLYSQEQLPGLKSSFYDLDSMTSGLQPSDLIILAGRPSMGKTAFGLNIARNIASTYQAPVALFSLEMSKEQLSQRLLASEAKIESNRLRSGRLSQQDYQKLSSAIGTLSDVPIFIDDTATLTVMEMRSQARRLQAEQGQLGLVLLDYLQLMEGGGDNRVQELSRITRSLKTLARELKAPVIALSQLSRGVEQRTNKRPMLSDLRESGCLSGDTLVTLADTGEDVPIKNLVGQSGFNIWAVNPDNWKMEKAPVSRVFSTGVKPTFELKTALGRKIIATGNHKFLTLDGWVRLDELRQGDYIALPRGIPQPKNPTKITTSEVALLGHLIGDGCTLPRHTIQYTTKEEDLADIVVQLAFDTFPNQINPRIVKERQWYQVYLSSSERLTHGKRNPIAEWLDSLSIFGLRSSEKFVPQVIFQQPEAIIATFLRHLWSTDGCIKLVKGKKTRPIAYYTSSSVRLAHNVQSLLLRLAINARIGSNLQQRTGRQQYQVILTGKPRLNSFIQTIGAIGQSKQRALLEINNYLEELVTNPNQDIIPKLIWKKYAIPAMQANHITNRQMQKAMGCHYCGTTFYKSNLSRQRTNRLGEIIQSPEISSLATSDVYWDKIVSITPSETVPVYDLTVPRLHNFVANNMIVHNSIEQDADLVLMLYRDAYYNPDTPDRDLAELIITKHRNGPTGTVKLIFNAELTEFRNMARYDNESNL